MKTIDLTPTWEEIMPVIIMAIENGTSEGKETMPRQRTSSELARKVDQANQILILKPITPRNVTYSLMWRVFSFLIPKHPKTIKRSHSVNMGLAGVMPLYGVSCLANILLSALSRICLNDCANVPFNSLLSTAWRRFSLCCAMLSNVQPMLSGLSLLRFISFFLLCRDFHSWQDVLAYLSKFVHASKRIF